MSEDNHLNQNDVNSTTSTEEQQDNASSVPPSKEKKSIGESLFKIFFGLIFISFGIIFFLAIYFLFGEDGEFKKYTLREDISASIVTALNNGADLRSIKNIYNDRNFGIKAIPDYFSVGSHKYYESNVTLAEILEDIRSGQHLGTSAKTDLSQLDAVIKEHNQVNPFDSLEPQQKDSFENVRLKLKEQYPEVELEVGKIVRELAEKNSLVNEYLEKSNISFLISIVALSLSLIIGAYQIIQSRLSASRIIARLPKDLGAGSKRKEESQAHKSDASAENG